MVVVVEWCVCGVVGEEDELVVGGRGGGRGVMGE